MEENTTGNTGTRKAHPEKTGKGDGGQPYTRRAKRWGPGGPTLATHGRPGTTHTTTMMDRYIRKTVARNPHPPPRPPVPPPSPPGRRRSFKLANPAGHRYKRKTSTQTRRRYLRKMHACACMIPLILTEKHCRRKGQYSASRLALLR